MQSKQTLFNAAAYGGAGWSPRTTPLQDELGSLWGDGGINSEWGRLKSVLLHRPGAELAAPADPDAALLLETIDVARAAAQHDAIAQAYKDAGAMVHYVEPAVTPFPNQMFVADLMFMTPEGAIVARPASAVRAGEERWCARRLADLGVPILRTVRGDGTFEGADAIWIDPKTVIIGCGLRTNGAGAAQVADTLNEMGIETIVVDLPFGTMHLMGMLRLADRDLAIAWPTRFAYRGVEALKRRGIQVAFIPDEVEAAHSKAFNFVTLAPRHILMAAGNPVRQTFYESLGITCHTVVVNELGKAAGAVGCLTGVVEREMV